MSESDPTLTIKLGENDFEMNRRNTFMFTFLGDLAIHDHIFMLTEPDEAVGTFVFKVCFPEEFDNLGRFMIDNNYIFHLNAQEVTDQDADAFKMATIGDVISADSFPDDWS